MAAGNQNLRKTMAFLRPYRRSIAILLLLTVVMAILTVVPPIITKVLVDKVFTQGDTTMFLPMGALMVVLWIVYLLVQLIQSSMAVWVGLSFVADLRFQLYRHILRLGLRFFGLTSTGKIVNRLMDDTSTVQMLLTSQTLLVVSDVVVATCAIIATFAISWRLAIVLTLTLVAFVLNYRLNIKKIIKSSRALRGAADRLSGGVQNRLAADLAVKTFGAEGREGEDFNSQSSVAIEFGRSQGKFNNNFWMNVWLIQAVGYAVLYFLGCGLVLSNEMTYGDVMAFTQYATQLLWPAVRFSQLAGQLQQVLIATDRVYEIFDEPLEIRDCEAPVPIQRLSGRVDFNDVHFHYVEGKEVIDGFSLHVEPGQTVALIGPTGCGKSTILNLVLRFYDVTGGQLLLDGVDIKNIELAKLRRQFSTVLQESHLFSTTIRENIRYARPNASDEAVEEAAKNAEIHDFIVSLPKGYDTPVGDFGVELSVGQKQRINIARAICADPAIMIMDEATSSLDSDSEAAIQRSMDRVLHGRTSFVVVHRLSTIRNADVIVLLDKGKIAEQGTHDQLMAIPNGRYQELYNKHVGQGVLEE